jgi:hypothetical protein
MKIFAKYTKAFLMDDGDHENDLTLEKEYEVFGYPDKTYILTDHNQKHWLNFDAQDDGFKAIDYFTLSVKVKKVSYTYE